MQYVKIPKIRGPYSHAVKAAGFLFVSGQLPIDPNTEELVEDTIEAQTTQVLNNIEAILNAHSLTLANIVKVEVYLKDMADAPKLNALYTSRFIHEPKPARQMMQVARLPMDVRVEISCIAQI